MDSVVGTLASGQCIQYWVCMIYGDGDGDGGGGESVWSFGYVYWFEITLSLVRECVCVNVLHLIGNTNDMNGLH